MPSAGHRRPGVPPQGTYLRQAKGWANVAPGPITSDFRWCTGLTSRDLHLYSQCSERPRNRLLEAGEGDRQGLPRTRQAFLWSPQVECFFCPVQLKASL